MLLKLSGLCLFWRKNNLPSIVFKCAFWAGIAWLLVVMFSDFRTALIGVIAAGAVAAMLYGFQAHKKKAKMKEIQAKKKEEEKDRIEEEGQAEEMAAEHNENENVEIPMEFQMEKN